MKILKISTLVLSLLLSFSCQEKKTEDITNLNSVKSTSGKMTTEELSYDIDGKTHKSYVAYEGDADVVKPVVMVLPEWWGVTDYAKGRAKQLAELGYFALVVDYYGEGKVVDNPEEAAKLSGEFYKVPINAKLMFDKAKAQLLKYPNANYDKIAVIGYCFGGAQALNMARLEDELKGVVSFHGNLMTGLKPKNNNVKILVLNGAADTFVPAEEIAAFKKQMDSAKIDYKFIDYPNALHSFTNPEATAIGEKFKMKVAYNKEADGKSWNDMKAFLADIFK
ncbi:dienelactone hydrolase family protein [Kaistella antarctica]|uniref:Dienelactone hydrolase n=1 Tax=Kaistella antarctica TaxID=266748 RepID=A0A3S4YT22_9FLAO|nr:dienelactone hydrolase family protein [Kaistella antarctica]KEY18888.1 dienelactone hydrolase [Kaistella antarctica]SEW14236.1 Dienelactone hydrolase [Kaistella antarctica]VEH99283.1 Predicted esterase [Kaistella antarctica]